MAWRGDVGKTGVFGGGWGCYDEVSSGDYWWGGGGSVGINVTHIISLYGVVWIRFLRKWELFGVRVHAVGDIAAGVREGSTHFMMGIILPSMVVTRTDQHGQAKRVQFGNQKWATVI